jgi:hypothetical protein
MRREAQEAGVSKRFSLNEDDEDFEKEKIKNSIIQISMSFVNTI